MDIFDQIGLLAEQVKPLDKDFSECLFALVMIRKIGGEDAMKHVLEVFHALYDELETMAEASRNQA